MDQCNSAAKPDSFGHYREAKYSQIKLHWAWKLNFIYQKIKAYRIDRAIFLEEDHFLTTDALHVAQKIIMPNVENCRAAGKICLGALGTYTKNNQKVILNYTRLSATFSSWFIISAIRHYPL